MPVFTGSVNFENRSFLFKTLNLKQTNIFEPKLERLCQIGSFSIPQFFLVDGEQLIEILNFP